MMRLIRQSAFYGSFAKTLTVLMVTAACTRAEAIEKIPAGTEVTVITQDGSTVRGKIVSVDSDVVKLSGDGPNSTTEVTRSRISAVKRVDQPTPTAVVETPAAPAAREADVVRTIIVPDNTALDVTLNTALASDTSRVEQPVNGTLASPVVVDGTTVIPAGSAVTGHVTRVEESGKVKGRAELAFRFTQLRAGSVSYDIDTKPLSYVAESTKKDDAVEVGVGAAAGAVIGAITGGKKGAAIGTAVGAGAGTGVVLATDGKEIRLAEGRRLKVSLTNPLTVRTK